MPNLSSDDPTLHDGDDIMEINDSQDDDSISGEDDSQPLAPAEDLPAAELVPELEHEIVQILATEEPTPKQKTQMISQDLINRELTPDDLMDKGSI